MRADHPALTLGSDSLGTPTGHEIAGMRVYLDPSVAPHHVMVVDADSMIDARRLLARERYVEDVLNGVRRIVRDGFGDRWRTREDRQMDRYVDAIRRRGQVHP